MIHRSLPLLLLLAVTPALAQEAKPSPTRAQVLARAVTSDWYGVYMQGKKCGYAQLACATGGTKDDPTFVVTELFTLQLVAMGEKTETWSKEVSTSMAPVVPRSSLSHTMTSL